MDLYVSLKICESCGCLWLRPDPEAGVYCTPCFDRLKQFPAVQGRTRRGPRKRTTVPTLHAVDVHSISSELSLTAYAIGGLQ